MLGTGDRALLFQDRARLASVRLPGTDGVPVNLLTVYMRVRSRTGARAAAVAGGGHGHADVAWLHLLDPEVAGATLAGPAATDALGDLVSAAATETQHRRRKVGGPGPSAYAHRATGSDAT
jgi:hypothetical protein